MKIKKVAKDYRLQIGYFVYDYVKERDKEYIVVGLTHNLRHYSVYCVKKGNLKLEKTTMPVEEQKGYLADLERNCVFIIDEGRQG